MIQPIISIVTPVYRCATSILPLYSRLQEVLTTISSDYEIIFVNDNSPDNSWEIIRSLAEEDKRVLGISLSRNFGQHKAITAGLDFAKGKWVVVMDCDLQDRPEEIITLFAKAKEGYDFVLARRTERQDSFFKKSFSKIFYLTLSYLTGTQQDSTIANFGIYNHKVIRAICSMRESIRYFPTMVRWVGFRFTSVDVQHAERQEGKSSYNFKRLLSLAMDTILANSDKPLKLIVTFGIFISANSFLGAIYLLIGRLKNKINVIGYASTIISIWFLSGVIICTLGIVGLYIGKIFEGVKNRPLYLIDETTTATKNGE